LDKTLSIYSLKLLCPKIELKTCSLIRSPQAPLIKGGIKGGIIRRRGPQEKLWASKAGRELF